MVSASATRTSPLGSTWIQRGCLRPVANALTLSPGAATGVCPGAHPLAVGIFSVGRLPCGFAAGIAGALPMAGSCGAALPPPPQDQAARRSARRCARRCRTGSWHPSTGSRGRWLKPAPRGPAAHARIIVGCCPSGPIARLVRGIRGQCLECLAEQGMRPRPLPRSPRACRRKPAPRGSRPSTTTTGKSARPPWRDRARAAINALPTPRPRPVSRT